MGKILSDRPFDYKMAIALLIIKRDRPSELLERAIDLF